MTPSPAERKFTEKLRDFCRVHRTGRSVRAEVARVALDWEMELEDRLAKMPPEEPSAQPGRDDNLVDSAFCYKIPGEMKDSETKV
jgi:hypothetical protein